MTSKKEFFPKRYPTKQNIIFLVIGGLVIVILIVIAFLFMRPEHTVMAFCRVAKEQKPIILMGNANNEQRLEAYKKLEVVSPDDIRSDITAIRKAYESIVQNPSNTISAGLGVQDSEIRRTDYITKNCKNF